VAVVLAFLGVGSTCLAFEEVPMGSLQGGEEFTAVTRSRRYSFLPVHPYDPLSKRKDHGLGSVMKHLLQLGYRLFEADVALVYIHLRIATQRK